MNPSGSAFGAPLGKPGDAFMLPRGTESIPHLHAVVLASDADTDLCIIVNFTSKRRGTEQTLVLDDGDHPFIKHESCALFSDAKIVHVSKLRALEDSKKVVRHTAFRSEVLKRIQEGLIKSSYTPLNVKEEYYAWTRAKPKQPLK